MLCPKMPFLRKLKLGGVGEDAGLEGPGAGVRLRRFCGEKIRNVHCRGP